MVVRAVEAVGFTTGVEENWVDIRLWWIGDRGLALVGQGASPVSCFSSFSFLASVTAFGRRVRPSAVMSVSVLLSLQMVVQVFQRSGFDVGGHHEQAADISARASGSCAGPFPALRESCQAGNLHHSSIFRSSCLILQYS